MNINQINKKVHVKNLKHPFHIVDPSPWPFLVSFSLIFMMLPFPFLKNRLFDYSVPLFLENPDAELLYFRETFLFGVVLFLISLSCWFRDIIREATFEGQHTSYVRRGLRIGMLLFIVSEVMFFFAFFWAFFHSSLNPVWEIGCQWPPKGIHTISPWGLPLLNTFILLTSGAYMNAAQYYMIAGYRQSVTICLIYCMVLAVLFTSFQAWEYSKADFSINDSVYGSCFYMITGLHGFHVIIGTIFIFICFVRHIFHHFTRKIHIGFECAAWYWHFVDVVWIFVFLFIYWWGS